MSQVAGPYGLRVVKLLGDLPFSAGMHSYPLLTNQAAGFYFGDPVGLVGGNIVALAASPTSTLSANSPIGIFMGCEYQDPKWGFVNAQYFPPGGMNAGFTQVKFKIMDWTKLVMAVQADGPVAANQIGMNAALGNFGAGLTSTGNSRVNLASASVGAAAAAVRIYDFVYNAAPSPGASSMPGDPFTDVLVVWAPGVHRFEIGAGQ